mmetsp:Transcript_7503/g.21918  ORF Transcript_7503/g.21918 Transcript_7503/m.21918 type:complete len:242 (-) Transcript_7503:1487-2212(-)
MKPVQQVRKEFLRIVLLVPGESWGEQRYGSFQVRGRSRCVPFACIHPQPLDGAVIGQSELSACAQWIVRVDVFLEPTRQKVTSDRRGVTKTLQRRVHEAGVAEVVQPDLASSFVHVRNDLPVLASLLMNWPVRFLTVPIAVVDRRAVCALLRCTWCSTCSASVVFSFRAAWGRLVRRIHNDRVCAGCSAAYLRRDLAVPDMQRVVDFTWEHLVMIAANEIRLDGWILIGGIPLLHKRIVGR